MTPRSLSLTVVVTAMLAALTATASAQVRPAPPPAPAPTRVSLRGFGDAGIMVFSAAESLGAVLGSRSGPVFGVGGEVIFPQQIFASVRLSWFQQTGERVFVFEGDTFPLGIDATVRVVPIEVTGGYRLGAPASRLVPYLGGGIGWHRYTETSDFATDDENVSGTHTGFHVLGGADIRIARLVRIGGEAQWSTVPDAIGQDPNSAAAAFGEDDLGGAALRVRIIVGR